MRLFLLSSIIFLFSSLNAEVVECSQVNGGYGGFLRGGEIRCNKTIIPAGFDAKIYYHSPIVADTIPPSTEVELSYLKSLFDSDGSARPGNIAYDGTNFTHLSQSGSNVELNIDGICTKNVILYLGFKGNYLADDWKNYRWSIRLFPRPSCSHNNDGDKITKLKLNQKESSEVVYHQFKMYKLEESLHGTINIILDGLSKDLDLYVKKGEKPSKRVYDCRPYRGGNSREVCTLNVLRGDDVYVGVHGYQAGNFTLVAQRKEVENIEVGSIKTNTALGGEFKYYKITGVMESEADLVARLTDLSSDIDLYIQKGKLPTTSSYLCRSWNAGNKDEECNFNAVWSNETVYIGVRGYRNNSSRYKLSLNYKSGKKATILLHGLASDVSTWDSLIEKKFNNQCNYISQKNELSNVVPFESKNYCFKYNFGKYDRAEGLKDLFGNPCKNRDRGCRGDYTRFPTLGREVSEVIKKVKKKLGNDVEITLLGHSRGGIAAVNYLGDWALPNKYNVTALLTTGTPFNGSPLGKTYNHMKYYCMPNSPFKGRVSRESCRLDFEAREALKNLPKKDEGLDIAVPSVGFLSEPASRTFSMMRVRTLNKGNRYYHNLVYTGIKLGDLVVIGSLTLNLFPSIPSVGTYAHIAKNFSVAMENDILGASGYEATIVAKSMAFIGDGIVPAENQDMKNIRVFGVAGDFIPGLPLGFTGAINEWSNPADDWVPHKPVSVSFNSANRNTTVFHTNTEHIDEPKQVHDISVVLDKIWRMQDLHAIPTTLKCNNKKTR